MFDPRIGTLLRNTAQLLGRSEPSTTEAILLERLARKRVSLQVPCAVLRWHPARGDLVIEFTIEHFLYRFQSKKKIILTWVFCLVSYYEEFVTVHLIASRCDG